MFFVDENEVSKLIPLCFQVLLIEFMRFSFKRHSLHDVEAVTMETNNFLGVIRHQPDPADTEITEDLSAYAIIAEVGTETQFFVCLHRIEAFILELVGLQFVRKA